MIFLLALLVLSIATADARVLHVGPGKTYAVPSAAAAVVRDGDIVEIDAGLYAGDVAVWRANRLTLRGVGGTARLRAEAQGYAPLTLSPFLNNPQLIKTVTSFRDEDLCNWQSFEELKRALQNVELVFRLRKAGP